MKRFVFWWKFHKSLFLGVQLSVIIWLGKAYIWVNTGSSNGLVPDGTKPLLKPVLTQIYDIIQQHQYTMI